MSLIMEKIFNLDIRRCHYKKEKVHQDNPTPSKVFHRIFSYLNLASLGSCCAVNKDWKQITNDPYPWKKAIYREIAFGSKKWMKYGGEALVSDEIEKDFLSLDSIALRKEFQALKRKFPDKNINDSILLVWMPRSLDINSLMGIVKKHFPNEPNYNMISSYKPTEIVSDSIDQSYWMIITKDVLKESRSKNYTDQKKIIRDLSKESLHNYEAPLILDIVTAVFTQHFESKPPIFSNAPMMYSHCKEEINSMPVIVGNFDGKKVSLFYGGFGSERIGMAPVKRMYGHLLSK